MKSAVLHTALCVLGLAVLAGAGFAAAEPAGKSTTSAPAAQSAAAATAPAARSDASAGHDASQHATFALGCFWSGEVTFEGRPGVISVTSGYSGGHKVNPTYEEVSTGLTGHYETVDIVFDPAKTSYAKLLDIFWHNVDPTQADGQFCDHGPEYHSMIFFHGDQQRQQAMESKQQIEGSGRFKKPIATQIVAAGPFYPAEEYHQDFYKKNSQYYHEYRTGCGRDARLMQLWGKLDAYAPGIE
jgi:peptide-methionine (S)-S-oxide reductase